MQKNHLTVNFVWMGDGIEDDFLTTKRRHIHFS